MCAQWISGASAASVGRNPRAPDRLRPAAVSRYAGRSRAAATPRQLPGRYTPTHRNTQLPGRRYSAPYTSCSTHQRVPTGSAAPARGPYGHRPAIDHPPWPRPRTRGPSTGQAPPAQHQRRRCPHQQRPGHADVRPDWQYHDPPDNQTSTPAQRPRSTAQQAKYYQSNLTEPHRTGQPRASPTPTGQGTPTGRTRPCCKVAPGPPKDRRTAEDSPRMQQQRRISPNATSPKSMMPVSCLSATYTSEDVGHRAPRPPS